MEIWAPKQYCAGKICIKKDTTYLGYKRSSAFLELKKSIMAGLLDKALFWAIELDISGGANRIYESLCQLAANEINITNPNLPSLLWQVYELRAKTILGIKKPNDAGFHDYQNLRNHLVQLVCVLTLSPKAKLYKLQNWKKTDKMDLLKVK